MIFKPQGYILQVNSEGYFQNPFQYQGMEEESKKLLHQICTIILDSQEPKIDSIYVRGSFASNSQVSNYSDIDLIIIHTQPLSNLPTSFEWNHQTFKLDISLLDRTDIGNYDKYFGTHFMLKTQSVCLWGTDRLSEIQDFPANKNTASKFGRNIPKLISKTKRFVEQEPDEDFPQRTKWIARALIRASATLFIAREKIYTRDLVYCYQYFSKYYPQYQEEMKTLVYQALEPTLAKHELITILDDFGLRLSRLIDEYYAGESK